MSSDSPISKLEEHPACYPTAYCLLTIRVRANFEIATLGHPMPGRKATHPLSFAYAHMLEYCAFLTTLVYLHYVMHTRK